MKTLNKQWVWLSTFLISPMAFADDGIKDAFDRERTQAKSITAFNNGTSTTTKNSLQGMYSLLEGIAVIIGLCLCIGGLMQVAKAAKSNGQQSPMPGWITFFVGGVLSVVGTIMFMVGRSTLDVTGGNAETS